MTALVIIATDSRVGRVGKVLRRTSLDELPQLWSILRGDMTLVGPRPERPHFVSKFSAEIDRYDHRHRVRAGLTGLAQVSGLLSEQRVISYVDLLGSTRVLEEIATRLRPPADPLDLTDNVRASSRADSVLLTVAVTDPSPVRAADVANEIGLYFPELVNELERPTTRSAVPPVVVRVVRPALVPVLPTSPGLAQLLGLGLAGGLLFGFAAALVRDRLDTRVRSRDEVSETLSAPVIGEVPFSDALARSVAVTGNSADLRAMEAFNQIRTNLSFVDIDAPPRVVLVTSSVENEGKTTTSCNVAASLRAAGSAVLLIEGDLRRPGATTYLGLQEGAGLTSVLSGRARLEQVVQPATAGGFDFLGAGPIPPNPSELLGSHNMRELLERARSQYDFVVIDTPPILPVTDAAALAPSTDGVIVVARSASILRGQLARAAQLLEAVSAKLLGSVITMTPVSDRFGNSSYSSYYHAPRTSNSMASPPVTPRPARVSRTATSAEDAVTEQTSASVGKPSPGHRRSR